LVCLHIDVECAQDSFFLGVYVWNQLQGLHVNRDTNPVAECRIDVLLREIVLGMTPNFVKIQNKVSLELLHVELEVADLRKFVHLLDEKHGVVLRCRHQQIIISESHQAVKLDSIGVS